VSSTRRSSRLAAKPIPSLKEHVVSSELGDKLENIEGEVNTGKKDEIVGMEIERMALATSQN